ncbi:MAG TPA: AMP-binding protein, partial [Woeseiaceae bacterium]|nr:AMP-binding protein [Woeseiaceae bacterium]
MCAAGPDRLTAGVEATTSVDELQALQLRRMRWTLDHAWRNVRSFRDKCEVIGVHPSDLEDLSDLKYFPFCDKTDFRDNYPFGLFAVPVEQIVRVHASSGTTGKATIVGYTRNDVDTWAMLCARSIKACGGRPGDRVHIAFGYGLFTGGLGVHYGAEALGAMAIPVSSGQTERQVQLIRDLRPDIIMCTPSYMLNIADAFERQGLDPADTSLRIGIFGAEPWSEAMRARLEERCGLRACDLYGLSEIIGPGVAVESGDSPGGLTVWEDHFYPEIVDPDSGEMLPDGEPGELVFTSLTKEALPIIRYRTHDLSCLKPRGDHAMRRIERISSRCDDMLIIRGVNLFPSQIEEQVLKHAGLSSHYQLIVRSHGELDHLTVRVEREPGTGEHRCSALAEAL